MRAVTFLFSKGRSTFETEVKAQRTRIAELEFERDQSIRCASPAARREVADRYKEILASLEERWVNKKKELAAVIQVQEVIANIDSLNEIKDGGLVVE